MSTGLNSRRFHLTPLPNFLAHLTTPKNILFLSQFVFLSLILTLIFVINPHTSPFLTSAQEEVEEETTLEGDNSLCQVVGNNLAYTFDHEDVPGSFNEADHTLAIINTAADIGPVANIINSYSGTVIVRAGASTINLGLSGSAYRQALIGIAQQTDKPFIAMATHNEPNGGENSPIAAEVNFGRAVTTNFPYLNQVTFISGQVDTYYDSLPDLDQSRANEYIEAYKSIPNLSGISIPLYTTPNFPTADLAFELYKKYVSIIKSENPNWDVFVTETGPFADYEHGFQSPFDEYLKALQLAVNHQSSTAILLFNSHGINDDELFLYTSPFWDSECREALRTQCFDTDEVLTACDGIAAYDPEGDHTCREFCRGTPYDPCAKTPGKDCSIPFDSQELFAPREELEENRYEEISSYLREYLPQTKINHGLEYDYRAEVQDVEICNQPDSATNPLCTDQSSTGYATIDVTNRQVNFIGPVQQVSYLFNQAAPNRLENVRQTINAPTGNSKEELGATQKQITMKERLLRLSILANFKDRCYQIGRVVEAQPLPEPFGSARCMNYQDWTEACRTGGCTFPRNEDGLLTEKTFWDTKLPNCRLFAATIDSNREIVYDRCQTEIDQLTEAELDLLLSSTDIPVARRPIIGGIDEISPIYQSSTDETANIQLADRLTLVKNDRPPVLGDLESQYYVYDVVVGDDAKFASDQILAYTQPGGSIANVQRPTTSQGPFANIFGGIGDIFSYFSNAPFSYFHIPERWRMDNRIGYIQAVLNQGYQLCKGQGEQVDTDATPTREAARVVGDSPTTGRVEVENSGPTSIFGVIEFINSLARGDNIPQNFQIQRFLNCELYPNTLDYADRAAHNFTQSLLPASGAQAAVLNAACQRKIEFETSLDLEFETDGQDYENCSCFPPGNGDNQWKPVEGNEDLILGDYIISEDETQFALPACGLPANYPGKDTNGYTGQECPNPRIVGTYNELFANRTEKTTGSTNKTTINNKGNGVTSNTFVAYDGASWGACAQNVLIQSALMPPDDCWDDEGYYLDNLTNCANRTITARPPNPDSGSSSACTYTGGFTIASPEFRDVIAKAAAKYNVPPQLVLAMIQGENCRFTSGARNVCQLTGGNYFEPGVEYQGSPGCGVPGSGTDTQMNGNYKGFVEVFSFAHNQNGWGFNRDPDYTNVCSIHDMTYAIAKVLASINPNATSPDWSRQELEDVIIQWVTGRDLGTGCATTRSDLPSTPAEVWTEQTKDVAMAGINIYCGYIDSLYNNSDPLYMDAACN